MGCEPQQIAKKVGHMEPAQAERVLLSSIQTPSHLYTLSQKFGISSTSFPYYPEEAKFIWDYITDNGKAPDLTILKTTYPDFDPAPTDAFDFISDEYARISLRFKAYLTIDSGAKLLESDPNAGVLMLSRQLERLATPDTTHRSSLERSTSKRFQEYMMRGDQQMTVRIKTGLEPIDNYPVWLQKQQFVGILADTKIGKSWIALKCAAQAFSEGKRVLIISPELNQSEMDMRSDTILARALGYDISYNALQLGKPQIKEEYKRFLDTVEDDRDERWITYDALPASRPTPSLIGNVITQEKPDVVVVDGIYCLKDDDRHTASWEEIRSISVGLKELAVKHNCLLYCTNQTNREIGKNQAYEAGNRRRSNDNEENNEPNYLPAPHHTAYGYDFARMVDLLMVVGARSYDDQVRQVAVPLVRGGKSFNTPAWISFVPDSGDIGRSSDTKAESLVADFDW